MSKINEENNDSTLSGDSQYNDAKQNARTMAKNVKSKAGKAGKKVLKNKKVRAFILAHLKIIIVIILVIILIIFLIGIIMLLITMPGLILGKLDKMAKNLWGNFSGIFTGDSTTAKVTKQEVIDLAQYVEDMGYDIQTYGLGDVKYKDDGKTLNNRNGKSKKIEKIGESVDEKNYLEAYIAADENTYVLAKYNLYGAVKSAINDIFGNDKDSSEIDDAITIADQSKNYSTGMINVEGYDEGFLQQNNSAFVSIDRETRQMVVYSKAFELLGPAKLISRTFFNTDSIKWGNVFTYDLDNWLARYGRPKELFLAIHLSTMMPDLAYTIATDQRFNTKVNIGMEDINLTFDVNATKDDETIKSDEIIDLFLKYCLKEEYRKDFSNASEEEKIKYFNEIWSKILKDKYFDKSDDKIPGKNWTYNEIICLAELAYEGNLSKTISYTESNIDSDIDNRFLFFLGVLEEGACEGSYDLGDSYGTTVLKDGAGATTAFGLTHWVYSGEVAKTYPNFKTDLLINGKVPKKEAQDIFVVTCEAAKEDILKKVKNQSTLTTNYLSALIDLHHVGPELCYKVINILNEKGSLTVEDFENNWGSNSNYANALRKRARARGILATEGRYLLYNNNMKEVNFKSSTPWADFCQGKPSSELYTLGQSDGSTTTSGSGGINGIKWPFIRSVTNHWFYDDIDFTKNTYRLAKAATKMIDYEPSDKNDPLNKENISVKLNATLTSEQGIIYQVCEPDADGPNKNIENVFKDEYYAYDGSLITAKKIANTKANDLAKKEYTFNGEEYSTKDTDDMKVKKQKVNFEENKPNTFTAFSILGNMHTEAAEYIYRNLKELVLKLGLLSENDLKDELKEILLWPIKTENQYTTWETDRDQENWGGTIKCNPGENNVIAPSDAIVEKIDEDSITLKFTTINDDTVKLYDYIYNRRSSKDKDSNDSYNLTEINKDILTDMKIIISNITVDSVISQGTMITRGQTLGKANNGQSGNGEIKIIMQETDKSIVGSTAESESIVEDLSEYFMQKHNFKYEEIMKNQMDNINKKTGIDIGNFGIATTYGTLGNNWTTKGVSIPVYMQKGQSWSNVSYGGGTIASSGCGVCALAMAVSGLTKSVITPDQLAAIIPEYKATNIVDVSNAGQIVANKYNLTMVIGHISGNKMDFTFLNNALDSGKVVIFAGEYTQSGHFVIVYGREGNNYYATDSVSIFIKDSPYDKNSKLFTSFTSDHVMIALGRK